MVHRPFSRCLLLFAAACGLFLTRSSAADPLTKIFVSRQSVVRVTDAALAAAGRQVEEEEIPRLAVSLRGKPVPALLERLPAGSREGRFALSFVGDAPHGKKTWDDPYVSENVYVLAPAPPGTEPARIERPTPARGSSAAGAATTSDVEVHHEQNRILIRFSGNAIPDELWFWEEVKATDPAPKSVTIPVEEPAPAGTAKLRVRFVGYSHLPADPDHTVQIAWNGEALGKAIWDGENPFVFEKEIPAASLKRENTLAVHALGETTNGIDLVLLDWVELAYPRRNVVPADGLVPVTLAPGATARVEGASGDVTFYEVNGARAFTVRARKGVAAFTAPEARGAAAGKSRFLGLVAGKGVSPRIVVSKAEELKAPGRGADYLVITHRDFRREAERLATARRQQGLRSAVVDVDDVYDRFSDGFLDPAAIRDFLQLTWKTWQPRPRYVLLLGDASWDYKNTFVEDENYADWHWAAVGLDTPPKIPSNVAGQKALRNDRQKIPTWQYQSPWGHAASDNYFVAPMEDKMPDVAIGRLPVATPEEARTIVDKILAYERLAPAAFKGALFITNDEEGFQRQTDLLVDAASKEGYEVQRVYPKKEEKDNAQNTRVLEQAFDQGKAFVLFNGHGGRYIWRTGPPDLSKNHDLFTLQNLDELHATPGLPVVVSLTCYSAPFDHPVADSIGEKLIRMPDKGAIGVVASSWRNAPPLELGRKIIELLGRPEGPRIGDAFLGAKRGVNDPIALATYNLLGDPATLYRGPEPAPAPTPASPRTAAR